MTSKSSTGGNAFLDRAYNATTPAEIRAAYDAWADQFDADLLSDTHGYVAPALAADLLLRELSAGDAEATAASAAVLDAGCGTGLVGTALKARGFETVDGLDISAGMLAKAETTGAYRTLGTADLSQPLPLAAGSYDAVTCVGTLTHGHLGPEAVPEFVRLTRRNGYVVATVVDDIWESNGYRAAVEALVASRRAELVSADIAPYRPAAGVSARMLVLRVL